MISNKLIDKIQEVKTPLYNTEKEFKNVQRHLGKHMPAALDTPKGKALLSKIENGMKEIGKNLDSLTSILLSKNAVGAAAGTKIPTTTSKH